MINLLMLYGKFWLTLMWGVTTTPILIDIVAMIPGLILTLFVLYMCVSFSTQKPNESFLKYNLKNGGGLLCFIIILMFTLLTSFSPSGYLIRNGFDYTIEKTHTETITLDELSGKIITTNYTTSIHVVKDFKDPSKITIYYDGPDGYKKERIN